MHKRLRALGRKFHRYTRKYLVLWIVTALIGDRVLEYTNNVLDSLVTQYQWVTGVKNVVLWFDSIALGFIGNLVVLTLLFILWRSYWDTRQDTNLTPPPLLPKEEQPPSTIQRPKETQLSHLMQVPKKVVGTLSHSPPNFTGTQAAEFIKNIQPYSKNIKIKIVSSQEYLEFAKLLASAFRTAGFTFEIDHQRAEDIFLARTSHDKLIVRYPETEGLEHDRHYPLLAYHFYFTSACQVEHFPKESTIDYFQIEIGGAP